MAVFLRCRDRGHVFRYSSFIISFLSAAVCHILHTKDNNLVQDSIFANGPM